MDQQVAIRLATLDDLPALQVLMDAAIGQLQAAFLSPEEIESSRAVMGLDRQLIADGSYFVAELGGELAGSGGWSFRATLYGGDHSIALREPRRLDPASEAARIRAMYTAPAFARRGVGRAILEHCETAARAAGFTRAELMGTLSGEPLYRAAGYEVIEEVLDPTGGAPVLFKRMGKAL